MAGRVTVLRLAVLGALAAIPPMAARSQMIVPGFEAKPFQDCADCPVMIALPNGLQISRAPVTRGEFSKFVEASGYERKGWGCNWSFTHFEQADDHPVVCVTWQGAESYVEWLSAATGKQYRLPTVAEMQYASMGNETGNYWWGQSIGKKRANCTGCGNPNEGKGTTPVGTFAPNPFGLLDAVGNVWIWTTDCRDEGCSERRLIGGSWASPPGDLRLTKTIWNGEDVPFNTYGIRVVRVEE
jgi:formylglycine-generating enzyme required for sulfatase activity